MRMNPQRAELRLLSAWSEVWKTANVSDSAIGLKVNMSLIGYIAQCCKKHTG